MYVTDVNRKGWDEYAERLTFALNKAQDQARGDTPFFLVNGWDSRSTLEASLPFGSTRRDPRRWRNQVQSHYQRARKDVTERLRQGICGRADHYNEDIRPHHIEAGGHVWLYRDRVKVGHARKPAHLWHGSSRADEMIDQHAAKLGVVGTRDRILAIMHGSKLVKKLFDPPKLEVVVPGEGLVNFDEAFVPKDRWERELDEAEYEVDRIAGHW